MGHLTDASVFHYCNIPQLPAGLRLLADSGFPAGRQLIVPARVGQLPQNIRRPVNRYLLCTHFVWMQILHVNQPKIIFIKLC